jgi:toxin YoeB
MIKRFSDQAWEDYLYFFNTDKILLKKIHALLQDIDRNGNEGIGKPEPLKYELSGFWSRRISAEHRLIYSLVAGEIYIVQMRSHY